MLGFTFGVSVGAANRPLLGHVVGEAGFDAAHALFLVDQAQHTIVCVVELGDIRGVLIGRYVGQPLVPIATPAQLVAIDLERLCVEFLNVIGAADVAQEALDIRQRKALAEVGEHVLVFTQVIHRAEVVERVIVFKGAAGQGCTVAGLNDFPVGDAVGNVAFDPLATHTATQGPVTDVVGQLTKNGFGGGLDVRAQFEGSAGLGVGQAIDAVLVAALA